MYFESQRKKHTILTERLNIYTHRILRFCCCWGLRRAGIDAKRTLQILEKILLQICETGNSHQSAVRVCKLCNTTSTLPVNNLSPPSAYANICIINQVRFFSVCDLEDNVRAWPHVLSAFVCREEDHMDGYVLGMATLT